MALIPTLAEVRADLDVDTSQVSDAVLGDILAAELEDQQALCRIPETYPAALRRAIFLRVARAVAMRELPLGKVSGGGDGGFGVMSPTKEHPDVVKYERRYRRRAAG